MQDPRDAALPPHDYSGPNRRTPWRLRPGRQIYVHWPHMSPLLLPGSIALVFWLLFSLASPWLTPTAPGGWTSGLPLLGDIAQRAVLTAAPQSALVLYLILCAGLLLSYIWGIRVCRQGPGRLLPARLSNGRITLRAILLFSGLFGLALIFAPGILSFESLNDLAAFRIMRTTGHNIYNGSPITFDPNLPLFHYITLDRLTVYGGPVWSLLLAMLGFFRLINEREPLGSLLALRAICLALHLGSVWLLWRCGGILFRAQRTAVTLLYAWNPLLLAALVLNASREAVTLAAIIAGIWLYLRQYRVPALVALTSAALTNPVAGVLVPPYMALLASQRSGLARPEFAIRIWVRSLTQYTALFAGLIVIGTIPVWAGTIHLFQPIPASTAQPVYPPSLAALIETTSPRNSLAAWVSALLGAITGHGSARIWEDSLHALIFAGYVAFVLRTILLLRRLATLLWLWLVSWLVLALLVTPALRGWSLAAVILLLALRGGTGIQSLLIGLVTLGGLLYFPLAALDPSGPMIAALILALPPLVVLVLKHEALEETSFESQPLIDNRPSQAQNR